MTKYGQNYSFGSVIPFNISGDISENLRPKGQKVKVTILPNIGNNAVLELHAIYTGGF